MKKVRYSLIALAVIVILICVSFRVAGLSLYQEKVQHRIENVLHYGPSDEVLFKFTRPDGFGIIVSKCGDEGISVIRTKRILYLPYKPTGMPGYDGTGYLPCNDQICVRYDDLLDMIYGIDFDHPEEDILVEIGTEQRQLFKQRVTTDERGFFHINDISTLSQLDMYDIQDEFYVYAESVLPVEGMDIRINSNMPRGLVADRSELDKLMPSADEFMSVEELQPSANLGSDVLNKINAGIKRYTGIDFFACEGVSDGETLCLYYDRDPWADDGLVLTFRKDGDRFVPVASDESMDTAAISWLRMNYGKKYNVESVSSKKIEVTEKDGKKQYRTLLSSYLSLRSNGVSGEMNVEVVVEADLNDPGAPWKMYYVSDLYGTDRSWELRDISELTMATYNDNNGVYVIDGYDAGHMEFMPSNHVVSGNSTDWAYMGELYYFNPFFLGDYFEGKMTEGGASWADANRESISFGFTFDNGEGGAVAGPTVSATVNLKTNEIVESDFSGFELLPFTDDELINMGHRLADIIESVEGIVS